MYVNEGWMSESHNAVVDKAGKCWLSSGEARKSAFINADLLDLPWVSGCWQCSGVCDNPEELAAS